MHQGENRTACECDVLEPEPDVKQHADGGDDGGHDGILLHLLGDCTGDGLGSDLFLIHAELLCKRCIQLLALFHIESSCLDDNFVGAGNLLGLHIRIPGYLFHNRNDFRGNLLQAHVLIEGNIGGGTALELHAVVQDILAAGSVDSHGCKAGNDHGTGQRQENLSVLEHLSRLAVFLYAVVLFILKADAVQSVQNASGDEKCGNHGKKDTERQCCCEALDGTGTSPEQYGCRDDGGDITIDNGGKCLLETGLDSGMHCLAETDLLTDTGEDDTVGIYGHTDGKNDTCNTRKGQGDRLVECGQKQNDQAYIQGQGDGCRHTGNPVKANHEDADQAKADKSGLKAGGDSLLSELCTDHVGAELFQLQGQGTDADGGRQVVGLIIVLHTVDTALSAGDRLSYGRGRHDAAVIHNVDRLAYAFGCRIGEGLGAGLVKGQGHHIFIGTAGFVNTGLCAGNLCSVQHLLSFGIQEHEGTGLAQLFQNRVGIRYTRNINIDAV